MAEGLKPSSQAKRVAFDGPGRMVIDGPFAETRELVAGFLLACRMDLAEVINFILCAITFTLCAN
jgi:hypothetical protein